MAFDLDGTLIDSVPDLATAVDCTLEHLGLPAAGQQRVRNWVGQGSLALLQKALTNNDQGELFLDKEDPRLLEAHSYFLETYDRCKGEATCLYPQVEETLLALQNLDLPMAVITNKPLRFVPGILEALNIASCFQLLLGGDSLDYKKPHPAPLLAAAKYFGSQPEKSVLVGDSRHDIQAAKAAGFISVGVPYGYNQGEPISSSQPDLVINQLSELLNQGLAE
ncbi:phosphoglycolate phosphatase [Marinospirillum celere]|uniref:phosphoglycolate phosphatase n=1 Tax=Marinospirillum celere TaxID=1122252 RepID=A0A1I1GTZ0_9GAMM|nr:phosphoglycolate phosphatase [Marinospirillum celere]